MTSKLVCCVFPPAQPTRPPCDQGKLDGARATLWLLRSNVPANQKHLITTVTEFDPGEVGRVDTPIGAKKPSPFGRGDIPVPGKVRIDDIESVLGKRERRGKKKIGTPEFDGLEARGSGDYD